MLRALLALLGSALAFTFTAPAEAGWKLDRATRIATLVWANGHRVPCVENMQVRWADPLPTTGNITRLGWINADPATGQPTECVIYFDRTLPLPWLDFCTTLIHEAGHLAGFRDPTNTADPFHSSNPRSVMYVPSLEVEVDFTKSQATAGRDYDRRCRRNGRWFLGL